MNNSYRAPQPTFRQVHQVAASSLLRKLTTLSSVDYADTYRVERICTEGHRPVELMRNILEGASRTDRIKLVAGWSAIGLEVAGRSGDRVLGWHVRTSGSEHVLLGAESRIGMPAELLVAVERNALVFATFVQQSNDLARAVWSAIEPAHVRFVPHLLRGFVGRIRCGTPP